MKETQPNRLLRSMRGDRRREIVAADVGISVSSLTAYENGTRVPRDDIKCALAKYYGLSVGELFFAETPTKEACLNTATLNEATIGDDKFIWMERECDAIR